MKQFFKILFASLFGAILGVLLLIVIVVAIVVGTSSASLSSSVNYKDKNVLVLKNVVSVGEISTPNTPALFSGMDLNSKIGLIDFMRVLDCAAQDSKISGIVLDDVVFDAGYASIAEIADALKRFKESGKFVVGHFNTLSQKSYLVASVCDEISMNSEGMAEFHGISATSIHYKNLLEKVGLKPVVIRCGKYKSYVESVTADKMSEENKEQKQAYINDIWYSFARNASTYRNINVSQLNSFADSVLVCTPKELQAFGFIDRVQYADVFWQSVKKRMELPDDEKVSTISFRSYMDDCLLQMESDTAKANNIAVIIAQGSIDMGKSDEESIGSETYVKLFEKVREDKSIQSVVFRINSGGGSALASELIWREVSLTAQEKPVIVSMGDMAASGGYYIASPATKIVASPMALTGSIGVFGMSMTAENLMKKIGVSYDKVNTHSHSDFGNITRDMEPEELKAVEKSIDQTYATFKQRVSSGRGISVDSVEVIAQGRVWSGEQAVKIGLVDTLGGVNTALLLAQNEAHLEQGSYGIKIYPKSKTLFDEVFAKLDTQSSVVEKLTDDVELQHILQNVPTESGIYAKLPYNILIK